LAKLVFSAEIARQSKECVDNMRNVSGNVFVFTAFIYQKDYNFLEGYSSSKQSKKKQTSFKKVLLLFINFC